MRQDDWATLSPTRWPGATNVFTFSITRWMTFWCQGVDFDEDIQPISYATSPTV